MCEASLSCFHVDRILFWNFLNLTALHPDQTHLNSLHSEGNKSYGSAQCHVEFYIYDTLHNYMGYIGYMVYVYNFASPLKQSTNRDIVHEEVNTLSMRASAINMSIVWRSHMIGAYNQTLLQKNKKSHVSSFDFD